MAGDLLRIRNAGCSPTSTLYLLTPYMAIIRHCQSHSRLSFHARELACDGFGIQRVKVRLECKEASGSSEPRHIIAFPTKYQVPFAHLYADLVPDHRLRFSTPALSALFPAD